jgi:hypothetical protein
MFQQSSGELLGEQVHVGSPEKPLLTPGENMADWLSPPAFPLFAVKFDFGQFRHGAELRREIEGNKGGARNSQAEQGRSVEQEVSSKMRGVSLASAGKRAYSPPTS